MIKNYYIKIINLKYKQEILVNIKFYFNNIIKIYTHINIYFINKFVF